MTFEPRTTASFWECYNELPESVRDRAVKQFALVNEDPSHPAAQLKPVGEFWSARVTDAYRVLAIREGSVLDVFLSQSIVPLAVGNDKCAHLGFEGEGRA